MRNRLRPASAFFTAIILIAGVHTRLAATGGNDSADWCVVSGVECQAKETSVSIQQGGSSSSFVARLVSPDRLNTAPFPINAYLSAGEWSADCGLAICGDHPDVTIDPTTLTFTGLTQPQSFTVEVFAGSNVVPGEYRFKIKTFGPGNPQLNAIGWGLGSGIEVTVLVAAANACALPTLTIVSPTEGSSLKFCVDAGSLLQTNGATPVGVSLSATSGITGFSAVVSRSDNTNQQPVTLIEVLNTDPATATGTGSAVGTIGNYKVVANATNACGTDTKTRNFAVNYDFSWLPPTQTSPTENARIVTKFTIRDCGGVFVSDETVEVTITDGAAFSVTRAFGASPSNAVSINTTDQQYHTNFDLPAGKGVTYWISVKFQGIQQGTVRTFTTKS